MINFDFKPSRFAFGIQILFAVFIILLIAIQLPWYITVVSFGLIVFSGWHFRSKKQIAQLAVLDQQQWSLGFDNGQVQRGAMTRVLRLPWLLIIYFEVITDEQDQSSINPLSIKTAQHYFIWKDQCDEPTWRYLRQLGI